MSEQRDRPRFAVLLNSLEDKYQSDLLRGVQTRLKDKATTLIVVIPTLREGERRRERLRRRLPPAELVDGVIVLSSAIGLQPEDVEFVAGYYRSPSGRDRVVSVGLAARDIPSILVNDAAGVRAAVEHLVKEHRYTRIGFLRGPKDNAEAEARFDAYRDELTTIGLYNDQLVSPNGDFSFDWGRQAMERLLGAWPWPRTQAVVAANDEIARGALSVIGKTNAKQRPGIVGFDDTEHAGATDPPLTTVRQPVEAEGLLAADWLLELHEHDRLRRTRWRLPTKLQIRQSCGCERTAVAPNQVSGLVAQLVPDRRRALDVRIAFHFGLETFDSSLIETEAAKLLGGRLDVATISDIGVWHRALVGLKNTALGRLSHDDSRYERQERFWINLLEQVAEQGSRLALRNEHRHTRLHALRDGWSTQQDRVAAFAATMEQLDIGRYWVCSPIRSAGGSEFQVIAGEGRGLRFPAQHLVPGRALPPSTIAYDFGLSDGDGYVAFELGQPNDWWMYRELARIARELCARQPSGFARNAQDGPDEPPPASKAPRRVQSLAEFEDRAGALLSQLDAAVRFRSASLQLLDGNMRELVLASNFDKEAVNRGLLRPISTDELVRRILESKQPIFAGDTRSLGKAWHPLDDIRAWIGAPVLYDDQPIGFLTVDFAQPRDDIEDYAPAVERFTRDVAPLLADARPYVRELQLAKGTRIVNETMRLLAQKLRPEGLLQTIAEEVERHLNCSHCTLFFVRKTQAGEVLVPEYASGSKLPLSRQFKRGEGFAGWVWQTGDHLVIENASTADERFADARQPSGDRSMLIVPIKLGDQTIGVISADQDAAGWFNERDAWLVGTLAQQAAIAIQRSEAIEFVERIAVSILSADRNSDVLAKVVASAVKLTNADEGVIYHLTDDKNGVREPFPENSTHPPPRFNEDTCLTREIILQRKAIAISDLREDPRVNPVLIEAGWKSMIGVPLVHDQDVVGVLYVNYKTRHVFTEPEVSLVRILADLAAIALQGAEPQAQPRLELPLDTGSIANLLRADVSTCVYLYDPEADRFNSPQAYGPFASVLEEPPRSEGTGRHVLRTRTAYYLVDVDHPRDGEPTVRDSARTAAGASVEASVRTGNRGGIRVRSFAALPLEHEGTIVGVLFVATQQRVEFNHEERRVLEFFARHVASAVANTNRYGKHKRVLRRALARLNAVALNLSLVEVDLVHESARLSQRRDTFEGLTKRLRTSTAQLRRMLTELQRDGEPITLTREMSSLNEVARQAVERFREASQSELDIELDLDTSTDRPLLLDRKRMVDCVLRLLDNAAHALDQVNRRELRVFTRLESNHVKLAVEDDGAGFPRTMEPTLLFEGAGDGLGVGLSIVDAVVRAHGGRFLWENSTQKLKGALVTICLPLSAES